MALPRHFVCEGCFSGVEEPGGEFERDQSDGRRARTCCRCGAPTTSGIRWREADPTYGWPFCNCTPRAGAQCTSESVFGERCLLEAGHDGRHRASIDRTFKDAVQIDEQGRVVRSPAITKLVDAVRAFVELNDGGASREPLEEALAAVDAEAKTGA